MVLVVAIVTECLNILRCAGSKVFSIAHMMASKLLIGPALAAFEPVAFERLQSYRAPVL